MVSRKHLAAAAATLMAALFAGGNVQAAGTSPTWAEMSEPSDAGVYKILQFMDAGKDGNLVIIQAGRDRGVVAGTVFKSYRPTKKGQIAGTDGQLLVETGRMKAIDVQDQFTVAAVEEQGSAMAEAFFPKFAGVMVGDLATVQHLTLTRRQVVSPERTLSYFGLFEDPKGQPQSFELQRQGIEKLRAAAQEFANARVSMLMVEGYTDHHGQASANQVESYQRAMTVRQFLIDEMGFDESRVVAVGFGEAEPVDAGNAPGYVEANRRIVLKAVAVP